jgi:hypothetical protein
MSSGNLVFPMAAMVLLTFVVAVRLFRARVRAVRAGQTPTSYFRVFQGGAEPEYLAQATRHFANLFETPILFYAGCLAAMVVGASGPIAVSLAWLYVASRCAHAWVHLGRNRIRHRLPVYLAGWIVLLGLWLQVCIAVVQHE